MEYGNRIGSGRRCNRKNLATSNFTMIHQRLLEFVCFLLVTPHSTVLGKSPLSPEDVQAAEEALKAAKLGSDGPALLALFRQRTPTAERQKQIEALVRQLGDDDFEVREKAVAGLLKEGVIVLPFLRTAGRHPDAEVRQRAAECAEKIAATAPTDDVLRAALLLLANRKPEGAAETLLAVLPALAPELEDDAETALAMLAVRAGKADPVLVAALTDPEVRRRASAAAALCRAKVVEHRPAALKLLRDTNPIARRKAALALAETGERDAVAVLIDLLAVLPLEQGRRIEERLTRLAGERSPPPPLTDEERAMWRDAWAAWWKEHGAGVELSRLSEGPRLLGLTLVIIFGGSVSVAELGPDNKERWRINNLNNATYAEVISGSRVLIAEYGANRVIECDFAGKVLRDWQVQLPLLCQRLANGNTFVVAEHQLVEFDPAGKQVFEVRMDLRSGRKHADGQIGVVNRENQFKQLDAAGKELKSYPVTIGIGNWQGGVYCLPGGRVLISQTDKVVEYGPDGKVAWEGKVERPSCVTRIANGNTLAVSGHKQTIYEFDRKGKELKQLKVDFLPWLAQRR